MLTVYVPREGSELQDAIWRGSAIVGSEVPNTERLRIDFEGDDTVYPSFQDRLRRAATRHTWDGADGAKGYPTQACAYVEPDEVRAIAEYDPDEEELEIHEPELFSRWTGSNDS